MRFLRSPHVHAGLCAVAITVLMMVPADAIPRFGFVNWIPRTYDEWVDKVQHLIAFMVMTVLMARSLSERGNISRPILMAALVTLGYSYFLEALQALLPWRYWDVRDLGADTIGVLLALPLARKYVRLGQQNETHS